MGGAENMLNNLMIGAVGVLVAVIGFFVRRSFMRFDKAEAGQLEAHRVLALRQESSLAELGAKIDRLADKFSEQMYQVRSEVTSVHIEFTREVTDLRSQMTAAQTRCDGIQRDLNNCMRDIRSELEAVQEELAAIEKHEAGR